jgi:hypothetical protein
MQIQTLIFLLSLSLNLAQGDSYVEPCVKMISFYIPDQNLTSEATSKLRELCTCQGKELRKRGVSETEIRAFTQNAGTATLAPETMKVAPKINDINNSDEVKRVCGSIFG